MNGKRVMILLLSIVFLFASFARDALAQFEELVKRIPATANALVMVDADEVYKSAVAGEQGWSKDRYRRFATGLTVIPPDASKIVLASQIDWEFMRANWEAELIEFTSPPDLKLLATQYEGSLDEIADLQSVALPDDTYFVQLSERLFGVMAPANRQVVSRWVRQEHTAHSPYLKSAVEFEDKSADIIFAFDLTDAMSEAAIKQRLDNSSLSLIKNSKSDNSELAKLLASIRGVMLGINFGTKVNGAIRVDFAQDASMLKKLGKPLLLHVLGQQGMMIDELSEWETSVDGNTLILTGSLSHSGLTRLASLVDPPTPVIHSNSTMAAKGSTDGQPQDATQKTIEASKQFYDSVNQLYVDLKRKKNDARTYAQIGYFYGKYAAKIAELPIANVDPEMLDYGQFVSMQLQGASSAIRNVGIRTGPKEDEAADKVDGSVYYSGSTAHYGSNHGYGYGSGYRYGNGYGYGSGYYGNGHSRYRRYGAPYGRYSNYDGYSWNGVYYDAQLEQKRRQHEKIKVRREERSKGSQEVADILAEIDNAKLDIRRAMAEKYKVDF